MRVKVEIEASDGANRLIFDESVSEEWQLSIISSILMRVYDLEKWLRDYVDKMPEEVKVKAEGVTNRG